MSSNNYIFFNENKALVNFSGSTALTAAQVYSPRQIYRFTATATVTLPTAADLVSSSNIYFNGQFSVGDTYSFNIYNASAGAGTLTIAGGTGGTSAGAITITAGLSAKIFIRLTNVSSGTEAYTFFAIPSL